MPFDLYAPCPCGSGKKFKWCCQPIHVEIDRAFQQDAQGQHEAALRIMDEVASNIRPIRKSGAVKPSFSMKMTGWTRPKRRCKKPWTSIPIILSATCCV